MLMFLGSSFSLLLFFFGQPTTLLLTRGLIGKIPSVGHSNCPFIGKIMAISSHHSRSHRYTYKILNNKVTYKMSWNEKTNIYDILLPIVWLNIVFWILLVIPYACDNMVSPVKSHLLLAHFFCSKLATYVSTPFDTSKIAKLSLEFLVVLHPSAVIFVFSNSCWILGLWIHLHLPRAFFVFQSLMLYSAWFLLAV